MDVDKEKIKEPRLIYIQWFDACYQSKEANEKELEDVIEIHSCGIFVRETKHSISIAQDFYLETPQYDKSWRYIKHIPKVNIIERRWIK